MINIVPKKLYDGLLLFRKLYFQFCFVLNCLMNKHSWSVVLQCPSHDFPGVVIVYKGGAGTHFAQTLHVYSSFLYILHIRRSTESPDD